MEKTTFTIITVTQLFSPIFALSEESNSHITTLRFKVNETLQINSSNFLIFNNTFNQGT